MKMAYFILAVTLISHVASEDKEIQIKNPLTIVNYGEISDLTWYSWFVIIYSFFVVLIVGAALFFP